MLTQKVFRMKSTPQSKETKSDRENHISIIDSIKAFHEFCIEDSIDVEYRKNPPSLASEIVFLIIYLFVAIFDEIATRLHLRREK